MPKLYLQALYIWVLLFTNIRCMSDLSTPLLHVSKIIDLPNLPSGSGMSILGDQIYVVGDDSPYLFLLSADYQLQHRQLILKQFASLERIPKPEKPDYESMAVADWQGHPCLLIFGSGSKSPQRDSLVIVPIQQRDQSQTFSLSPLYDAICRQEGIGREDLNIEGAILLEEQLWLMNRGRNSIISLSWPALSAVLEGKTSIEELSLQIHPLTLPQIAGKQARISGACNIEGSDLVLFTATVEDTENWIDDGDILGSFVGILDAQSLAKGEVLNSWLVADQAGKPLLEKLESIDVLEKESDQLRLLAIADNDAGSSRLLELILKPFSPPRL